MIVNGAELWSPSVSRTVRSDKLGRDSLHRGNQRMDIWLNFWWIFSGPPLSLNFSCNRVGNWNFIFISLSWNGWIILTSPIFWVMKGINLRVAANFIVLIRLGHLSYTSIAPTNMMILLITVRRANLKREECDSLVIWLLTPFFSIWWEDLYLV